MEKKEEANTPTQTLINNILKLQRQLSNQDAINSILKANNANDTLQLLQGEPWKNQKEISQLLAKQNLPNKENTSPPPSPLLDATSLQKLKESIVINKIQLGFQKPLSSTKAADWKNFLNYSLNSDKDFELLVNQDFFSHFVDIDAITPELLKTEGVKKALNETKSNAKNIILAQVLTPPNRDQEFNHYMKLANSLDTKKNSDITGSIFPLLKAKGLEEDNDLAKLFTIKDFDPFASKLGQNLFNYAAQSKKDGYLDDLLLLSLLQSPLKKDFFTEPTLPSFYHLLKKPESDAVQKSLIERYLLASLSNSTDQNSLKQLVEANDLVLFKKQLISSFPDDTQAIQDNITTLDEAAPLRRTALISLLSTLNHEALKQLAGEKVNLEKKLLEVLNIKFLPTLPSDIKATLDNLLQTSTHKENLLQFEKQLKLVQPYAPSLLTLFKNLSVFTQNKILAASENHLAALIQANNEDEINNQLSLYLNAEELSNSRYLIGKIAQEHLSLDQLYALKNPGLILFFHSKKEQLPDADTIEKINTILMDQEKVMQLKIVDSLTKESAETKNLIEQQALFNLEIINPNKLKENPTEDQHYNDDYERVVSFFLRMNKTGVFKKEHIEKIIDYLKKSKTLSEFKSLINNDKEIPLDLHWSKHLSQAEFLKWINKRQHDQLSKQKISAEQLDTELKRLESAFKSVIPLFYRHEDERELWKKLDIYLPINADPVELNAKINTHPELKEYLLDMFSQMPLMINHLQHTQNVLKEAQQLISSQPDPNKKIILSHLHLEYRSNTKRSLEYAINKIDKTINFYKEQLKRLNEINSHFAKQLHFNQGHYLDVPVEQVKDYTEGNKPSVSESTTAHLQQKQNQNQLECINPILQGYQRIYTTNNNAEIKKGEQLPNYFIERHRSVSSSNPNATEIVIGTIPEEENEKALYFMTLAIQLMSKAKKRPSFKNLVVLTQGPEKNSAEKIKGLIIALLILGETNGFQFSLESIDYPKDTFDPQRDLTPQTLFKRQKPQGSLADEMYTNPAVAAMREEFAKLINFKFNPSRKEKKIKEDFNAYFHPAPGEGKMIRHQHLLKSSLEERRKQDLTGDEKNKTDGPKNAPSPGITS